MENVDADMVEVTVDGTPTMMSRSALAAARKVDEDRLKAEALDRLVERLAEGGVEVDGVPLTLWNLRSIVHKLELRDEIARREAAARSGPRLVARAAITDA